MLQLLDQNTAVSQAELGGRKSIQLSDGADRVLVKLDVFYNLNCLNTIRKYLFRDYYGSSNDTNDHEQQVVVNECIDMIRQSLMCHGDIAIETYRWKADRLPPWPIFHIEHECRNWDSILQWAKEHHVPSLQGGILKHPIHGISTDAK